MNDVVEAFLSLPIGGRATIFIGILLLMWCVLGRIILKILSILPWFIKKIVFGLYMLLEIPVSILHSKFGSAFAEIDQGITTATEKFYKFMEKYYEKMNNPKIIHSRCLFVVYLVIVAYLLIPIAANLKEKPFTFWQKSYVNKEDAFIQWMEDKGWLEK